MFIKILLIEIKLKIWAQMSNGYLILNLKGEIVNPIDEGIIREQAGVRYEEYIDTLI